MLQHQVARDGRTVKSEKTNCRQVTRYMVPPQSLMLRRPWKQGEEKPKRTNYRPEGEHALPKLRIADGKNG